MNALKTSLFILMSISLSGCSDSAIPVSSPSPFVDFECNAAQSNYCTSLGHNKKVYMGMTQDLSFDCEQELLLMDSELFVPSFDYSGSTLANFNGSFLDGIVTDWINSSSGRALTMPQADHMVCAFLDYNDNGQLDFNEPLATAVINPGEDFFALSQWQ